MMKSPKLNVMRVRYDNGLVIPGGVEVMQASEAMIKGLVKVLKADLEQGPDGVYFTIKSGDTEDRFIIYRGTQ